MRLKVLLVFVTLLAVALSGCTSGRDIAGEAKEREAWARDHNEYSPVAILSGPERIAPGALVWYSAHGSHDPDFFGAKRDQERNEARGEGGFHARNDASSVQWSWDMTFADGGPTGLGHGIRKYVWQIDDQPPVVAHELTHRYGSEDGPVRFPVGFPESGTHELTLTVIDWSGDSATVRSTIHVVDDGIDSTVRDWRVTSDGWVHERIVPVPFEHYGECPPLMRDRYDATLHRMDVPWDLMFFAEELEVSAAWVPAQVPPSDLPPVAPSVLHGAQPDRSLDLATASAATAGSPGLSANTNDIGITLGHCETGDVWARFDSDQEWTDGAPVEGGATSAEELARNVEKVGSETERVARYDFNVYLSDSGSNRGGNGADVVFQTLFVPAKDTSAGGQ